MTNKEIRETHDFIQSLIDDSLHDEAADARSDLFEDVLGALSDGEYHSLEEAQAAAFVALGAPRAERVED